MRFIPYIAFVILFSWLKLDSADWLAFSTKIMTYSIMLLPVLLMKCVSLQLARVPAICFWLLGFVGIPVIHFFFHTSHNFYSELTDRSIVFYLWLLVVECIVLLKTNLKPLNSDRFKRNMTMDTILIGFTLLASLFWAMIFNSVDNPIANPPTNILIDLERNLLKFNSLLSYLWQFIFLFFAVYSIYWVNHHFLVNRIMAKFGVFHYIWAAGFFVLIAAPLLSQVTLYLPINEGAETWLPSGNTNPFDYRNIQMAVVILVVSLPLILVFKWQKQMADLAIQKKQNVQTELKWLQQQINPHFLFNTLNNLYSLTLSKADKAPRSILQLANLLRFVVYKGGQDKVLLSEELAYLKDYIALQQIRVSHKTEIEFNLHDEQEQAEQLVIAPLLFINLIENAFKHGIDASDKRSWLSINMQLLNGKLHFECSNSVDKDSKTVDSNNGGLGLENLKRRLQLLYPNKHKLLVESNKGSFKTSLTITTEAKENNE